MTIMTDYTDLKTYIWQLRDNISLLRRAQGLPENKRYAYMGAIEALDSALMHISLLEGRPYEDTDRRAGNHNPDQP